MNIKNIIKTKLNKCIISTLLMVGIAFFGIGGVKALPASITINNNSNSNFYCPLSTLAASHCSSYITTTTKIDIMDNATYCLNRGKGMPTPARGVNSLAKGTRLSNSEGYSYILENGYPHKSITGNKQKDNYITQLAIWWYKNANDVATSVKNSSDDLVKKAKALVDGAKAQQKKYDALDENGNPKLTVSKVSGFDDNGSGVYVAKFKVTSSSDLVTKYDVTGSSSNSSVGYTLTDSNGTSVSKGLKVGTTYYIKVKASEISDKTQSINFKINAKSSYATYSAYNYTSDNGYYQDMILFEKSSKSVSAEKTFTLKTIGLKISKTDITGEEEVCDAQLSITTDAAGKTIAKDTAGADLKWTSCEGSENNTHYINDIADGTYYLNEVVAPTGYYKASQIKFKVTHTTDNKIKVQIANASGTFEDSLTESGVPIIVMKDEAKPCYVWVAKVDPDRGYRQIEGATLVIKDSAGKVVKTINSLSMYATRVEGLSAGTYTLEETVAPAGYYINKESETFTIVNNGGSSCGVVTIADTMFPSKIKVAKVDPKGNYIAGAVLEIREAQTDKEYVVKTITSTEEPIEVELPLGSYKLVETKAPDGYTISEVPVEFEVTADGGIEKVVTIANDLTPPVPNTLATISTILYIASGLAIAGGAYVIYKNKFSKKIKKVNK